MTDREYLELAAKAAGHRIVEWVQDGNDVDVAIIVRADGGGFSKRPWQPMHENQMTDSDGDALRLAVRLGLHARQFPVLDDDDGMDEPLGMVEVWRVGDADPLHVEYVMAGDDPLVATRRAIVRAAAAIGRNMT